MKNWFLLIIVTLGCVDCALFNRRTGPVIVDSDEKQVIPEANNKRTTRRSMEEESMLGESSGSLWSGRGQASYLFTNNNQRLLGDLLNVNLEGYPKEQIQMKVNTIAKLLAGILNDQKQEIQLKEEEIQKKNPPPPPPQEPVQTRGVASDGKTPVPALAPAPVAKAAEKPPEMTPENKKEMRKIEEESQEIADMQKAKEFPIRSVPTHVVEVQKDGTYRVKGEKPFYIGKREYKLTVGGLIKAEDFDDKGVSAELLMEPTFDITSDKKSENL